MIPGKLYCSPVYNTEIWGSIENYEGKHYVLDFLMYMPPETVFMVIENNKDNFYSFSKVLDENGNIGYIRCSDFGNISIEVKE